MKATTFETKLGKSKAGERSRIWIEGARLVAAGFKPGDHFFACWYAGDRKHTGSLTLYRSAKRIPAVPRPTDSEERKVSGKAERPIIDIVGQRVHSYFGKRTKVIVEFDSSRIYIR